MHYYFILDGTIASLSHDSLRLYKRRSKSDGALNKQEPGKLKLQSTERRKQVQSLEMEEQSERKYTQKQARICKREKLLSIGRSDRATTTKYRLNRKSRSLGDLDCSDGNDVENDSHHTDLKRRYKPVPKLRSKESLRRIKLSSPSPPVSVIIIFKFFKINLIQHYLNDYCLNFIQAYKS